MVKSSGLHRTRKGPSLRFTKSFEASGQSAQNCRHREEKRQINIANCSITQKILVQIDRMFTQESCSRVPSHVVTFFPVSLIEFHTVDHRLHPTYIHTRTHAQTSALKRFSETLNCCCRNGTIEYIGGMDVPWISSYLDFIAFLSVVVVMGFIASGAKISVTVNRCARAGCVRASVCESGSHMWLPKDETEQTTMTFLFSLLSSLLSLLPLALSCPSCLSLSLVSLLSLSCLSLVSLPPSLLFSLSVCAVGA